MKKKPPAHRKPSRRTTRPRPGTKKTKSPKPRKRSPTGALWTDDRAFRILVQNSHDIFTFLDASGKILYRSPTMRRVIRLPEEKVLQSKFLDWIWPEDRAEARKVFKRIGRSPGKDIPFQVRVRNEEGTPSWIEGYGTNYLDNPVVKAILVVYRDVTEFRRQQAALSESERRYRELFEHAVLPVFQSTFDGKILRVNRKFAEVFGYDSPEDVADSVRNVASALFADPSRREEIIRLRAENPNRSTFENLYRRKDGSTFWGLLNVRTVTDADGRPSHFEGFVDDISERKRAEQALQESEEKASAIIASAPYGLAFVDATGVITYANTDAERILGLRRSEIVGRAYDDPRWKITTEDGRPFPSEKLPFARVMATGQAVYGVEHTIEKGNGKRSLLSVNGAPLIGPGGEVSGMVAAIRDITESRRAEEALRESEERYRSLFENSLEGIGLSRGNRVVGANKALLDIFGYTNLEEFRSVPLLDHVAPESKEFIREIQRQARTDGLRHRSFSYTILRKDGEKRDLEISTGRVLIGGEPYNLSTFRDITERKRTEADLHALVQRHGALLEAIPEIVMEVDAKRVYTWANPAGIEFFGGDVIGKEAAFYFEGEQDTYAVVQPLFNGGSDTVYVESWQRRKDGRKRLLAWWCRNLKNSSGEVTGALSSARDITEQRRAEEEIENISRFPEENPNPVMRILPDGVLLFANKASRAFLEMWKVEVGQKVPDDCRALIREVVQANAVREVEYPCGGRIFLCSLSPIQNAGYVNLYGRDITDRKHAEEALAHQAEELRQRNAELARLNELTERRMQRLVAMRAIDTAITSSFRLELVLNIILGHLTDLLGIHAADVLIFVPDLQTFRFACGRGFRNVVPAQTFVRKTGSYANQAAQERRTLFVPNLEEHPDGAKFYPRISGESFSSYLCVPLLAKGLVKGILELFHRDSLELASEEESFLEMVAGQAAIAIDNSELFEGLQATNNELTLAYTDTLTGWARTLELRNRETAGEAQRLAETTVQLARSLGAGENDLILMYRGAILHDIGMMGIPDSILLKPGSLTKEEREIVRKHPQYAYDLLSTIKYLRSSIDIPYCHHERWDGSGYPRGLVGDQIPLAARIFAVLDVWDALRSRRPYRGAWTDADAREYLRKQSGTLFDPRVVQVFFEVLSGL